jgi:hypothetical protein
MEIGRALDGGYREVEVAPEAQEAWLALLLTGMGNLIGAPDCTPGYCNSEGQPLGPAARLNVGYPAGPSAYFKYLDAWRKSGAFEGFTMVLGPSPNIGVDPVWWTPLKLIFEVSDAPLSNRLSSGIPATDGRSSAIWTHARGVGA